MDKVYVCDSCGDEIDIDDYEVDGFVFEGTYLCSINCLLNYLIDNGMLETLYEHIENLKDMIETEGE